MKCSMLKAKRFSSLNRNVYVFAMVLYGIVICVVEIAQVLMSVKARRYFSGLITNQAVILKVPSCFMA